MDTSFILDLPSGPLDTYRKRATFDWKKLRILLEEANLLKIKVISWFKRIHLHGSLKLDFNFSITHGIL